MSGSIILQIFLIINVFFIGMLTATGIRHAIAHFKHAEISPENTPKQKTPKLSTASRERILQHAEKRFQSIIDNSSKELSHDLAVTSNSLNKKFEKNMNDLIEKEINEYKIRLNESCQQIQRDVAKNQTDIINYQDNLKRDLKSKHIMLEKSLEELINTKKTNLMNEFDAKLNDAIASFLVETMQHNIDIGAQGDYLISMLKEHKNDILKELEGDI